MGNQSDTQGKLGFINVLGEWVEIDDIFTQPSNSTTEKPEESEKE